MLTLNYCLYLLYLLLVNESLYSTQLSEIVKYRSNKSSWEKPNCDWRLRNLGQNFIPQNLYFLNFSNHVHVQSQSTSQTILPQTSRSRSTKWQFAKIMAKIQGSLKMTICNIEQISFMKILQTFFHKIETDIIKHYA